MNLRTKECRGLLSTAAGLLFLAGSCGALRAQVSGCQEKCAGRGSVCWDIGVEFGKGSRYNQCVAQCKKKCETSTPPVVLKPKYLVLALMYAPPGCTSSADYRCQLSTVTYGEGSSLGTGVSTSHSFKEGTKISGNVSTVGLGADAGFGDSWSNSSTATITKSGSASFTVQSAAADGIDHGEDEFLLELNPTVTLTRKNGIVYWSPGVSGGSVAPVYVFASELENPATMRSPVAIVLKEAGLTTQDYACILSLDPFGGPSRGGRLGLPVYCKGHGVVNGGTGTGPSTGATLDPNRFILTTLSLPYEPPQSGACGLQSNRTLKNDFGGKSTSTNEEDYTVGFTVDVGIPKVFDLKEQDNFTWTSSATKSSTTDSSQSASATIRCPSPGYNDPRIDVQIYWDKLYSTFLFKLVDPAMMQSVQLGKIVDTSGKPIAWEQVSLTYGGKTYHTLTGPSGIYRFLALRTQPRPSGTGLVVAGRTKRTVSLGSQTPTVIKVGSNGIIRGRFLPGKQGPPERHQ